MFRPPATRSCIIVDIIDDVTAEPDEQFSVNLSNPSSSSLVTVVVGQPSSADVIIIDNDAIPPSSELTHGNNNSLCNSKRTNACVNV